MNNQMKFSGKVTAIGEPTTGKGAKGDWESVMVIVTEDVDKYPQNIAIECFNKEAELDKICVGAMCDVLFNVEANEYKGKIYGKNKLWKFDNIEMPQRFADMETVRTAADMETVTAANDETDLPF